MILLRETWTALALVFLLAGCTQAEFGGGNDKPSSDANGKTDGPFGEDDGGATDTDFDAKGIPDDFTDDLLESGWINNESYDDFDTEFDGETTNAGGGGGGTGSGPLGGGGDTGIFTDEDGALQSGSSSSYAYWQPCDDESFVTEASTGFTGPDGSFVRVSGSFCPRGGAEINALFIIDFSGSMVGGPLGGGNDPTKSGTCGRLEATEAILKNLIDESPKGSSIRAGILGFSNDATMRKGMRDAEDLLDDIDANILCGSDGIDAWTNYEAAFEEATKQLKDKDGAKVIYFISDGFPTRDSKGIDQEGERARESGLNAADDLMDDIDDLTMEVIFLGNIEDEDLSEDYLEDLADDPDNVTLVRDADDLGDAAAQLEIPALGMKKSTFKAEVKYPDGSTQDVEFEKIANSKKFGTTFMTEPFALKGSGTHEVIINAETDDGEELESQVEIKFRATP